MILAFLRVGTSPFFLFKSTLKHLAFSLICVYSTVANAQLNSATTSLVLATSSDSEKTKGRHVTVTRYADAFCAKRKTGSKLLRKKYAKARHEFAPLQVATGEPFIFQVNYQEKRRDSERVCAAQLGFTPKHGRLYRAEYQVSGQVSRCEITLYDITGTQQLVKAEITPEFICTKKGQNGNKNGVPSHSLIDRF